MRIPPFYYNQEVFRQLPDAAPEKGEAWLMLYSPEIDEEQIAWGFLLAPSSLKFSRSAEYGEQSSFAAKVRDRQYSQTSGATLSIPNIQLSTWYYRKSVRPLIEGINLLLEAKADEFSPPILSFVMGKRRFAPCVLTEISWDETGWLGGETATATLSITLAEIPTPGLKRDAVTPKSPEIEEEGVDESAPRNELTDRQRKEASDAAKAYLTENREKFAKAIDDKIRANAYFLETDRETGKVSMLDASKDLVGIVGTYNGQDFDPSSNNLPTP